MGTPRALEDWDLTTAGGRLAYARAARGLGRNAMAQHYPMKPEQLRVIERGNNGGSAPYELARFYAAVCDVSITWLIDGGPTPDLPRVYKFDPAAQYSSQIRFVQLRLKKVGPRSTWPRYKHVEPEGAPGSITVGKHGETPVLKSRRRDDGGAARELAPDKDTNPDAP